MLTTTLSFTPRFQKLIWRTLHAGCLSISLGGLCALAGCNSGSGISQPDDATPTGFTVSGKITGLNATGLILQLNGANNLSASGTSFAFSTKLKPNSSYAITVLNEPTGELCTVNAGSGSSITSNISNAQIICSADTYNVSGTVTGLGSGGQLTLVDNGSGPTVVTSNTNFTLATQVAYASAYDVTLSQQPVGQNCTVTNGTGSNVAAAITNVSVGCVGPSFDLLYSFHNASNNAYDPYNGAPVQASDGNFYGTTLSGGAHSGGAIFRITPQGTESLVYSFSASGATDGNYPYGGGLVVGPDGAMYGTTYEDGPHGCGTLFRITTSGQYSVVYAFPSNTSSPCYSYAGVTVGNDGNFYGMSYEGGTNSTGTIYKVTPSGTMTLLHSFGSGSDGSHPQFTTLVEDSAGNFYGVANSGGANSDGVLFKLAADNTYSILHTFGSITNDGRGPSSSLTFGADGYLYGVTSNGGTSAYGVMFKISTSGAYTILHNFDGSATDISSPYGQPLLLGNDGNFYSSSYEGGASAEGTLYKVTPTGTVTILHSFTGSTTDGSYPYSGIVFGTDGYIYGFTETGGAFNQGTFYRY